MLFSNAFCWWFFTFCWKSTRLLFIIFLTIWSQPLRRRQGNTILFYKKRWVDTKDTKDGTCCNKNIIFIFRSLTTPTLTSPSSHKKTQFSFIKRERERGGLGIKIIELPHQKLALNTFNTCHQINSQTLKTCIKARFKEKIRRFLCKHSWYLFSSNIIRTIEKENIRANKHKPKDIKG